MALNITKPGIATFILFGLVWITLIISFSTYWYRLKIESSSSSGSTEENDFTITVNMKYNEFKVTQETSFGKTTGTTDIKETDQNRNQLAIFKTSLAFSVIGWLFVTASLVMVMANIAGLFIKLPKVAVLIAKFTPIVTLGCCFIALFVFLGLPNATKRDCMNSGGNEDTCSTDQNIHFMGSHTEDTGNIIVKTAWGPTTSWAAIVCATALQLAGTIVNIMFQKYEHETPK
ncbi:hypothetical protein DFA_02165 [Cavenderia fasciculata]|uniref:Transmembrane protein n=1 Tax=Cavenderia fasciculata TaxID=261658 RepID=F4PYB1_CACFS|nr:uncharacterized protein DFA_02165 [Cavenderia fasciculata]EGG19378.1 hypothetical protein DFA_02165 [Cavenderia fasciculata]|eukprot:XP_004357649.1 hypothetical protein DFA_02165 [Cavenderia fasciculata]